MEKIKKFMSNINVLLLTIYISLVCNIDIFLNFNHSNHGIIFMFLGIIILAYTVSSYLYKKLSKIELTAKKASNKKENIIFFFVFFFICLFIFLLWHSAYYPGFFSPDSKQQYEEATNVYAYNDWHPVLHTILFFKLPLMITGQFSFIISFQIILFSLILGYTGMIIQKHIGVKQAFISLGFIVLNPYTGHIILYPWKDVAFGMCGLLCIAYFFDLYFSNKFSNIKTYNIFLFGLLIACTTIFRHNACLFTFPFLFVLFFYIKKIDFIKLFLATIVILFLIKVPLYHVLRVEKPNRRVVETMGLPLNIIATTVKEAPDKLDNELQTFAYTMITEKEHYQNYQLGNFNTIKWAGANLDFVDNSGYYQIIRMALKCFKHSPKTAFRALFGTTDVIYGLETLDGDIPQEYVTNDYGIDYNGNLTIAESLNEYTSFINNTIFKYFRTYGVVTLVMLIFIVSKLNFKSKESLKLACLCSSIFIYNLGTMLLLAGPDSRFFYINFLVCPIIILVSLYKRAC